MFNETIDDESKLNNVSEAEQVSELVNANIAEEEQYQGKDLTVPGMWEDVVNAVKTYPVTLLLVLSNIITFVYLELNGDTLDGVYMLEKGAMNPALMLYSGQWYRLFTAMFMHFGVEHLFNNMLLLFCIGRFAERALKPVKYIAVYFFSGIIGGFVSFMWCMILMQNNIVCGASGAIFGIIGSMLIILIVHKGRYEGIKIRSMVIMAGLSLYFGFATAGTDNAGHLGGLVSGIVITFVSYGIPTIISNCKRRTL